MKKLLIYTSLFLSLLSPFALATTNTIYASTQEELKKGACLGDADCVSAKSEDTQKNVNTIVNTIIDVFSWLVGVVAVIMVIFGGFRYITAAGDSGKTKTAKDTILYALIGVIIVALAQTIVKYVIGLVVE